MPQMHCKEEEHPETSFYEATTTHAREWILMKIEHFDDAGMPCGFIHAHSPDNSAIWLEFKNLVMTHPDNARNYTVFYGGEYVREGPVLEAAARKFVEEFRRAKENALGAR